MTLKTLIHGAPTKEILRAYNSSKAYLFFEVHMFNVGANINIICTDTCKQINYGSWNGYDQLHENDDLIKLFLLEEIKQRNQDQSGDHRKINPAQQKRILQILKSEYTCKP